MRVGTKEKLKAWGLEGSLALGAAIIFSSGAISPLTLMLGGLFLTLQAKANFPIYSFIKGIRDELDSDYIPDEGSDSEDEELDQAYEDEFGDEPIHEGIRAQLFETSIQYVEPENPVISFMRKLPGTSKLLGERKIVTREMPKLDTGEIARMEYGRTRSGFSFRGE